MNHVNGGEEPDGSSAGASPTSPGPADELDSSEL
jgi:hypothetical protein